MQQVVRSAFSIAAAIALAACYDSESTTYATHDLRVSKDRAGAMVGFSLHGSVTGFGPGIVALTGGGSYDPSTATNTVSDATVGHGNGGFSCLNTVDQLNFNGCQTGQGVRWDTEQLLASSPFKCNPAEAARTGFTDGHTVVFKAGFYRAGDGNDESFRANMIVADHDIDDQQEGVQNIWIQGVGCGTGTVNFSGVGRPFVN